MTAKSGQVNIRKAGVKDSEAIVELLKLGLGEELMPKSIDFWNWKHRDNPFGTSPVLVAEDEGRIVGVRAFMRWRWRCDGRTLTAVRAVDTATHPQYQGKGIFSRLTMKLVDECRQEGVNFIFNTPNKISKPGYLKLGWRIAGRLPVRATLKLWSNLSPSFDSEYSLARCLSDPGLENLIDFPADHIITDYSTNYLRWRYRDNPNVRYCGVADFSSRSRFFLVFRIKDTRFGRELRVCDALIAPGAMTAARKALDRAASHAGARILTMAGRNSRLSLLSCPVPIAPEITVLELQADKLSLRDLPVWTPSLGDMEVF